MKTFKLLASSFLFLIVAAQGRLLAQTAKDIFNPETPITYHGIDFSQAKLIGDAGANALDIKARMYSAINQVVINEAKKYDVSKAVLRTVTSDITVSEAQNAKANADSIKSQNKADLTRFTPATIDKMVSGYNFNGKKGIGLIFITEAMSKTEEKSSVWVTFVDMSTNKVLLTERLLGKAGGFGFKNYWAKPYDEIIQDVRKHKYEEWSKKYK